MKEIELKFQIPANALAPVRAQLQAIAQPDGQPGEQAVATLPLHAAYFDTPDHALARHRCALRVRREGDEWVQTYKGAGQDTMTRVEENIDVPAPADGTPRPDLSLHSAGVRAGLARALNWDAASDRQGQGLGLRPLYETRFQRSHTVQRLPAMGGVQVCLDEGEISAGALRAPLAELELELIEGSPQALITLAEAWVAQHGLWLDVQSKAMKGTRLARVAATGQPTQAHALALPEGWAASFSAPGAAGVGTPQSGAHPSWQQAMSQLLDVAAGNWAEVALNHPGWPAAMKAWATAHAACGQSLAQHPGFAAWLGATFMAQHVALQNELASWLGAGDGADANPLETQAQAQALATSATPTLWALRLLSRLNPD